MKQVNDFEQQIAKFFGSQYAVATDCCTHAIELCLRLTKPKSVTCPIHTYLSVPMTFEKLEIPWHFYDVKWSDYYYIGNTNIIDAAVHWKQNSYIPNTFMCLSFQYKKHLNLGRGGMILLDKKDDYIALKKMSYDGRYGDSPWADQTVDTLGYHYYMTPETAQLGINKLKEIKDLLPKQWSFKDYPDISQMKVFKNVK
jgi:dTDP-4-amino-4,6-dideoxygalactose transaminase